MDINEIQKNIISILSGYNNKKKIEYAVSQDIDKDFTGSHLESWKAIKKIHEQGETVDAVILYKETGDSSFISDNHYAGENIKYWIDELKEYRDKERFAVLGEKLKNMALSKSVPADDIRSFYGSIGQSLHRQADIKVHNMKDLSFNWYNHIIELQSGREKMDFVPSGILEFDKLMGGYEKESVIIGARPSIGKTALAMHCALQQAQAGYPVLFFSYEMRADELYQRIVAHVAQINSHSVRLGKLDKKDLLSFEKVQDIIYKLPVHIIDDPLVTLEKQRYIINEYKEKEKIRIVYNDHLELIPNLQKAESLRIAMSEKSKYIKNTTKVCDIPIVTLCQLKREAEGKERRPYLSDLKETGNIEQDADIIFLVHGERGKAWRTIYQEKTRNGATGEYNYEFVGQYYRFNPKPGGWNG